MNRRDRRGQAARSKIVDRKVAGVAKALAADGGGFATRKEINEFAQQVNDALHGIAKLVNQNQSAITRAFTMTDAHLQVSRRIINDQLLGCVKITHPGGAYYDEEGYPLDSERCVAPRTSQSLVDYDWYYQEYNKAQHVILFMQLIKKFVPGEETAPEPQHTDELVFGGDHGQDQASP